MLYTESFKSAPCSMLVILLLVVASTAGAGHADPALQGMQPQINSRIVGGHSTTISSYPWQISLQRHGSHFCGGAIYSLTIIVTAAHCLEHTSIRGMKVRAGSSFWNKGGSLIAVAAKKSHAGYNTHSMINDIAIIRLKSALTTGSTIKTVPLAENTPADGTAVSVSGWGETGDGTDPEKLIYVDLSVVSKERCSSDYSYSPGEILDTMFCAAAKGKDSCQGDSGGPLVSDGILVGVVSWGTGCADKKYPGVYADVAALRSWVANKATLV